MPLMEHDYITSTRSCKTPLTDGEVPSCSCFNGYLQFIPLSRTKLSTSKHPAIKCLIVKHAEACPCKALEIHNQNAAAAFSLSDQARARFQRTYDDTPPVQMSVEAKMFNQSMPSCRANGMDAMIMIPVGPVGPHSRCVIRQKWVA